MCVCAIALHALLKRLALRTLCVLRALRTLHKGG